MDSKIASFIARAATERMHAEQGNGERQQHNQQHDQKQHRAQETLFSGYDARAGTAFFHEAAPLDGFYECSVNSFYAKVQILSLWAVVCYNMLGWL